MIEFRKRTSPRVWFAIIATLLVLFLVWQFVAFQFALTSVPHGWTISGAQVTGLTYQQAIQQVQDTLTQQPIRLKYQDQVILVQPAEIGVTFNPTLTLESIVQARSMTGDPRGFVTFIVRRVPPPQDIPAAVSWPDEKLRAYLARVADQYDLRPQEPTPILDGLRMAPGRPGYELDISGSIPAISLAITSAQPEKREATLQIKQVPPVSPRLESLDALLKASLRDLRGIAGIFVKDLVSGEEYSYNGDVAFSGLGLLKISIMAEIYRRDMVVPQETVTLIEQMMVDETGNGAANTLLQHLGDRDADLGVARLTNAIKYLGLVNTFMATPYDQDVTPITVVTPANSRLDISTVPDPKRQTTPQDIVLLLEMIYDCNKANGALMIAYPNAFTVDECHQMLGLMARTTLLDQSGAPAYLRGGLPADTVLAHKYSWSDQVRADAGIVLTEGHNYALAVFLYIPDGGDWQQVNPIFKDIAHATFHFFTAGQ